MLHGIAQGQKSFCSREAGRPWPRQGAKFSHFTILGTLAPRTAHLAERRMPAPATFMATKAAKSGKLVLFFKLASQIDRRSYTRRVYSYQHSDVAWTSQD